MDENQKKYKFNLPEILRRYLSFTHWLLILCNSSIAMFEVITLSPPKEGEKKDEKDEVSSPENDSYDPMDMNSDEESRMDLSDDDDEDNNDPLSNTSKVQARLITFDKTMNILADPGWDGKTDLSYLAPIIPKIDLILLSQTTVKYLGAYAYLLHKYPILKKIKTYATFPIAKLGRLSTIELYRSVGLIGPIEGSIMEIEDIESSFNSINMLNYAHSISLQGKLAGITITAYNSGHTLGGSVWLLNKQAEKVVYAPVWNHSKDLFLRPCKLLGQSSLARPTTFLSGSDLGSSVSHRKRMDSFLQLVELTLYNGTSILLPTSLSGRFFEILPYLDQMVPREVPFYLVAYTGIQSLKSSASMLEWMSPDVTKGWDNENQTPFDSTRIELCTVEDLSKHTGPKVVFVESLGFDEGSLARSVFVELCSKQNTALFLTERPPDGTVLYDIYNTWEETVREDSNLKDGSLIIFQKQLTLSMIKETSLRGQELKAYLSQVDQRREKRQKEELEERKNSHLLNDNIGNGEDEENSSDSEEDEEEESSESEQEEESSDESNIDNSKKDLNGKNGKSKNGATTGEKDGDGQATISSLISKLQRKDENKQIKVSELLKLPMDFDVRNVKSNKNSMFPFIVDRVNVDDYGIEIDHDDFKRDEEKFTMKRGFDEMSNEKDGWFGGAAGSDKTEAWNKRRKIDPLNTFENQKPEVITVYNSDSKKDPASRTMHSIKVDVRCGLTFIDLSGSTDLRSWKFNANGLKPRKVVVMPNVTYSKYLGGSLEIMKAILKQQHSRFGMFGKENADKQKSLNSIHSQSASGVLGIDYIRERLNRKVDLGNVISSYMLRIDESLDTELAWQVITGGYSIAHVNGEVRKIIDTENDNKDLFKLVPSNKSIRSSDNKISIGDIKLNELRKRLGATNHIVEFRGEGTLVVDDQLAVRKINDGNLMIDGGSGKLFYEVRRTIRSMLAYV